MGAIGIGLGVLMVLGIGGCTLEILFSYGPQYGFDPWVTIGGLVLLLVVAWGIGAGVKRLMP
jgi:hypothetical protein